MEIHGNIFSYPSFQLCAFIVYLLHPYHCSFKSKLQVQAQ